MYWLFFIDELLSDATEIAFVIKLMAFVYMLFWLYYTFNRIPILFGLTSVILAYFIFVHSVSTMLLVLFLIGFVFLGSQLQMLVWFGLSPIARLFNVDLTGQEHLLEEKSRYEQQNIYSKLASNQQLTEEEMMKLEQMQSQQQHLAQQQQYSRRLAG